MTIRIFESWTPQVAASAFVDASAVVTGRVVIGNDSSIWPQSPDGAGSSLELIDPLGTPIDQMGKSYVWRSSSEWGGSPGEAGQGPLGVVINEVISNTGGPVNLTDSIELHNTTDAPIDIGGWKLSDSFSRTVDDDLDPALNP